MTEAVQVTSGFVEVTGGQLYYEVAGAGHPLVLIHAGVADCRMWDAQFSEFARHYRVIRYDTRGFGRTRTEAVSFSNRQDLADLLAHLGVQSAYVIGVSRSGQIAIDFTLEHPGLVAALIPVAAGISGYEFDESQMPEPELALINAMEAAWKDKATERMLQLELQMWVDGPGQPADRADPQVREQVYQMMRNNADNQTVEGQPQPLEPPAIGRLGAIKVPTLIILGDLDTSDTLAMADVLEQSIAGARKVIIPGTAHLPSMEQPATFNRIVLDFLGSLQPATS